MNLHEYRLGIGIGLFFGAGLAYLIMTCWYHDQMKKLKKLQSCMEEMASEMARDMVAALAAERRSIPRRPRG